jgi:hypothetical protein
MPVARILALVTACVAVAALALQLFLIIQALSRDGVGIAVAVWRFFGFFTILTNCGVALVGTAMVISPDGALASARARLVVAVSIVCVGIVYSVALRAIWDPQGWQAVADHALHDATPLLFFATWTLARDGTLGVRDAAVALLPPLTYCIYALIRGSMDGWYAYWFLDPRKLGLASMTVNIAVLVLAFGVVALALVWLDRWGKNALARPGG